MQIELINVSVEDKGKYKAMEVAYKADGKINGKKLMSFGGGADVFKYLTTAPAGVYDVGLNKNDKGYWDWVSISPAGSAPEGAAAPAARTGGATVAPRNTYETPEERAKKQVFIVRQSSVSNALSFLALNPKKVPTTEEVVQVARQFENYVFGVTEVVTADGGIAEFHDDIPY